MKHLNPLIITAFVCACVCIFAKAIARWIRNSKTPVMTVSAEVLALFTKENTALMPMGTDGAMMPVSETVCRVRFLIEDGGTPEFTIPRRVFKTLSAGDRGRLTYQGTRFRGFAL